MIKIAICDDDILITAKLEKMISISCNILHQDFGIDIYYTGESLENKLKDNEIYHLIFLDIELGTCTDIDVSRFIRDTIQDDSTQIIYVSGKNGYDRQLFEFRPMGFIEKPFEQKNISNVIEKYIRIYGSEGDVFTYKYGRDTFCVNIFNIIYFKSADKKVLIKTNQGEEEYIGALKTIQNSMSKKGFIMPHRSYLVNYRFVRCFQPNCLIMTNGDEIPISKNNKQEIMNLQLLIENGSGIYAH